MKNMKLVKFTLVFAILFLFTPLALAGQDQDIGTSRWVIDDVLTSDTVPFAIGHRGYGVNSGEISENPIENTTRSVRRAFREGIQIVEVDAVLTADGVAVALHDDFLPDLTCVNTLTFEELKEVLPKISSLRQILKVSRTYSVMNRSSRPRGQVVVEIKTPAPMCVPLEEEPFALQSLVEAVMEDIRFTRMMDQVVIESYSPEILGLAAADEPDIPRALILDAMQLLPLELIELYSDYKVQRIEKDAFGLAWGEIGIEPAPGYPILWLYRLPGYFPDDGGDAFASYIMALAGTGSSIATLDKLVLFMASDPPDPLAAREVVDTLHMYGFHVLVYTAADETEWWFVSTANTDGIFVDDIPMGLMMEGE